MVRCCSFMMNSDSALLPLILASDVVRPVAVAAELAANIRQGFGPSTTAKEKHQLDLARTVKFKGELPWGAGPEGVPYRGIEPAALEREPPLRQLAWPAHGGIVLGEGAGPVAE